MMSISWFCKKSGIFIFVVNIVMVMVMFISQTEQGCNFQLKIYVNHVTKPFISNVYKGYCRTQLAHQLQKWGILTSVLHGFTW